MPSTRGAARDDRHLPGRLGGEATAENLGVRRADVDAPTGAEPELAQTEIERRARRHDDRSSHYAGIGGGSANVVGMIHGRDRRRGDQSAGETRDGDRRRRCDDLAGTA